VSEQQEGAGPGGLNDALTRLAAAAVALLRTRAEIAALDFDEAGKRAKERVALLIVGLLCVAVGVLASTAFVIVYFWDTYRLTAFGLITVGYLLVGALALWRFSVRQRTDPRPFAATIAELERDVAWLARKRGSEK
jgi:uncharacterized membrane protein YqjE